MKKFTSLLLALPLLFLSACSENTPNDVEAPQVEVHAEMPEPDTGTPPTEDPEEEPENGEGTSMSIDENAVVFNLAGENYKFLMDGVENPELRVKEGDTVVINFISTSGFHDWVVDEFDAATAKVQTGDTTSVTFVAEKKGEFEYYCSVGNHRQQGMVGKLIVE